MSREIKRPGYFLLKMLVLLTHFVFLGTVLLNGKDVKALEILKLSVTVIASDLIYFVIFDALDQENHAIDILLVLIVNISLIFQSCFTGIHLDLKHFVTIAAGMACYIIGFLTTRNSFKSEKYKVLYYIASVVIMLVIVVFAGPRSMWINIGGISLQPSEFLKPLLILICATSLKKQQDKKQIWLFRVAPNNIAMVVFGMIIIAFQWWCRDLGSIPMFAGILGCAVINRMCYPKAKFSKKRLIALGAVVAATGLIAIKFAPGYVKDRLYVDIWADRYGDGYQQCEALIAIAEGGWFGKGPGHGTLYTVDSFAFNTDTVFSSVSEEWGLLASLLFVALLIVLLATTIVNVPRCYYHGTIAVGVTAVFIIQMSLNIFGSCNLIPFTGVTLPFLSNGGTSMVTSGFLIGMLRASQSPDFVRHIVEKTPKKASVKKGVRSV